LLREKKLRICHLFFSFIMGLGNKTKEPRIKTLRKNKSV